MNSGQRWVVDAYLAELPPRLRDFAELPLWQIDRIRTLATQVQHELEELRDDGDTEADVLHRHAVAAEAMCWHPRERECVEQYLAAQRERLAWLRRSELGGPDSN